MLRGLASGIERLLVGRRVWLDPFACGDQDPSKDVPELLHGRGLVGLRFGDLATALEVGALIIVVAGKVQEFSVIHLLVLQKRLLMLEAALWSALESRGPCMVELVVILEAEA